MYNLPGYVWALVLVGAAGIPATTCVVLYRGALATGLERRTAVGVAAATAAVLSGWLLVTGALANAHVYLGRQGAPWFGVAAIGCLVTLLLATRLPLIARILAAAGTAARLAVPHTERVIGGVFLIVMALGHLPAAFALPAGLGDIAIGVAAPFVALRLARDPHGAGTRTAAVLFNMLGLLDFVVASTLGALLAQPFLFGAGPSTEPLFLLPLVLIPTAAVPVASVLHLVSLRRLRATAAPVGSTAAPRPSGGPAAAQP